MSTMSTSPPPPPTGGAGLVPLPLPPAIATRLPPCPPAGDEPRLHLGAAAGLSDLRAALQADADASGEVQRELQGLIEAQKARDVPVSADDDEEEGADETYAGPGVDGNVGASAAEAGNGAGTKRGREAATGDGQDVDRHNSEEDDEEEEEGLLAYHPDATVMLRNSYAEDDEDEGTGASAKGHLFVTTRRILFLSASSSTGGGDNDAASIDAGCVVLHALSECEERGWHVYCQLDDGSGGGGSGGDDSNTIPDEAYFYPSSDGGGEGQQKDACQRMFDAFSALASLNPIYGDDDDNAGGGGGGFFGMMAGMGEMMTGGDDADNDEMVCRLGEGINLSGGFGPTTDAAGDDDNGNGGATEEERAAMLERLDGMLVVPAEYEIASGEDNENEQGGQFDDAEESGDELL